MRGAWPDSFEFKEFEEFRNPFRDTPTLRVAADCLPLWGDIAARPQSFGMPARHCVAGHLSRAHEELFEVFGLDVKRPHCLLEALGVMFEALEPS